MVVVSVTVPPHSAIVDRLREVQRFIRVFLVQRELQLPVDVSRSGCGYGHRVIPVGGHSSTRSARGHRRYSALRTAFQLVLKRVQLASHLANDLGQGDDVVFGQRQRLDFRQPPVFFHVRYHLSKRL